MARYIYSISQLEEEMKSKAHEALKEVAESVLIEWKCKVKRQVYEEGRLKADPSNNYYKRTNQLLESLELQWINPLEVVLGYNADKILPSMMLNRYSFNRHTSFSGEDWSNAIPTFIEEGNGDSPIYSYEGIHSFDEIIQKLNSSFQIMMKQALQKKGLNL